MRDPKLRLNVVLLAGAALGACQPAPETPPANSAAATSSAGEPEPDMNAGGDVMNDSEDVMDAAASSNAVSDEWRSERTRHEGHYRSSSHRRSPSAVPEQPPFPPPPPPPPPR